MKTITNLYVLWICEKKKNEKLLITFFDNLLKASFKIILKFQLYSQETEQRMEIIKMINKGI